MLGEGELALLRRLHMLEREELGKAKADPRFRFKRVYPLAEDLAEVVMAAKHEHIG